MRRCEVAEPTRQRLTQQHLRQAGAAADRDEVARAQPRASFGEPSRQTKPPRRRESVLPITLRP